MPAYTLVFVTHRTPKMTFVVHSSPRNTFACHIILRSQHCRISHIRKKHVPFMLLRVPPSHCMYLSNACLAALLASLQTMVEGHGVTVTKSVPLISVSSGPRKNMHDLSVPTRPGRPRVSPSPPAFCACLSLSFYVS